MKKIIDLLKIPGVKLSAVFLGVGIVLSLVFLVLIFAKAGNNIGLSREIDQLRDKIENVRELTEDEEKFIEEDVKIKRKYELVSKKIPKTAQIPKAIDQLTSGIESLNLKLISIEPKDAVEIRKQKETSPEKLDMELEMEGEFSQGTAEGEAKPDYIQIPIEINLRGAYIDIGHYLDTLRYLPRLVTVEEINIEKAEEGDMLDIKLLVSVWYSED